ncbi:DUF5681 domain-containing protein [Erythrobacter sp. W53]|uniref:DUF5681 domain-containing protein n=1 Tax=Erythrobacter sp. W53 TaxID=3425947 RepID=UPI003D7688C9
MPDEDADQHRVWKNRRTNGRFRPGKSGNPSGRPKRSLSTNAVFQRMLSSKVPVISDGKRRMVTVVEAMAERVKRESLTGPLRGLEKGIAVAKDYSLNDPPEDKKTYDLSKLTDEELDQYGRLAAKL